MPSMPDDPAIRLAERLREMSRPRSLVAIAGPPGAGKSTLAARVRDLLVASGRSAAVVPMDGFHLDNSVLRDTGLLARKGAPETFDGVGFVHLVRRIAAGDADVVYPVFDRRRDIAVAGAGVLSADTEFVLFEGNYLLLRDPPWAELSRQWDLGVWVDAPMSTLEARLMERWRAEGLDEAEARSRVHGNDLPNVRFVIDHSAIGDPVMRMEA
jgi:pantothenate kinase